MTKAKAKKQAPFGLDRAGALLKGKTLENARTKAYTPKVARKGKNPY
jgi:hypothetical protein